MMRALRLIAVAFATMTAPVPIEQVFTVPAAGEAVAVIHASCERCDWGIEGREAAAVKILVDGNYSQHLLLTRGAEVADYHISLGAVAVGNHRIRLEADPALSAPQAGLANIAKVDIVVIAPAGDDF